MTSLLLLIVLMFQGQVVTQGGPPPAPVPQERAEVAPRYAAGEARQGVHHAFNSGDETKFLAAQETYGARDAREAAAGRTREDVHPDEGGFRTLKVKRAAATPERSAS